MILALVLSCFPTHYLLCTCSEQHQPGLGALGDTHHFYFVNQPTGKVKSLMTLTDLKLFCNNYMPVWLFYGSLDFFHFLSFFFFFNNQIDLTRGD